MLIVELSRGGSGVGSPGAMAPFIFYIFTLYGRNMSLAQPPNWKNSVSAPEIEQQEISISSNLMFILAEIDILYNYSIKSHYSYEF